MSDSSSPLAAGRASAPTHASGTALLASLSPLLTEWLPRQRWFAGGGRDLAGLSLVASVELLPTLGAGPGLLHLLVRAWHTDSSALAARPESGPGAVAAGEHPADCYQLLLGVRPRLPEELAHALVGRPRSGPLRGRAVYEALLDPRLASVLLERLRTPGSLGPLRFTRVPQTDIADGLTPRPLAAEQSNSSVIYGRSHILKLFRRVERGVNPDLELSLALARHGCDRVPAPTAWFEATPRTPSRTGRTPAAPESRAPRTRRAAPAPTAAEPRATEGSLTLGVLQPFFPEAVDGWQLALRSLGEGRHFTAQAHALGRTTAQVHRTLAEALPTNALGGGDLEEAAAGMTARLESTTAAVPALRPYRARLLGTFRALSRLGSDGRRRRAQRVHGDLHLGQVLQGPEGDWSLIDFEGEPARPLAERCHPQPAVRDVAGMLRSFDYASYRPGARSADDPWARSWAEAARSAYCDGYAESAGSDPRDDAVLLRAYETDKAVYEVRYEARHRPSWLPVPLSAVRRLAAPPTEAPG